MDYSPEQERALATVSAWLKDPNAPQVFYLAGFAGTGKTTLAKTLAESTRQPAFCSYTGKAASVMRRKGCDGASTIHSLIYKPAGRSQERVRELEAALGAIEADMAKHGKKPEDHSMWSRLQKDLTEARSKAAQPSFVLNPESILTEVDLCVVDECSMVDARIGEDLCSFGRKMLVLGDPAQLPPVMGGGFFTAREPDFMLTEVHRQAKESPVLHLATAVREGQTLPLGNLGSSKVINRAMLEPNEATEADQILVGKNKTRKGVNRRCRVLQNRAGWMPEVGERLVCLKNDHKAGFLNGTIWNVDSVGFYDNDEGMVLLAVSSLDEEGPSIQAECTVHHFQGHEGRPDFFAIEGMQEFDYGYGLTVHKAQGSQWDDVLLFDESGIFRQDARRWLYTGITRAAERITIVKG